MMVCTLCKYEWCWVCGFKTKSIIHFLQGNNAFFVCGFLNSFTFGFEKGIHWTLRILLSVLVIPTMPFVLYISFSCLGIAYIYGFDDEIEYDYACLACCDGPRNKFLNILYNLVLMPFRIAVFFILVAVIFSLCTIPAAIFAPIYYLLLLLIFFRILFRWICCCRSKRGGEVNDELLEKYRENMNGKNRKY